MRLTGVVASLMRASPSPAGWRVSWGEGARGMRGLRSPNVLYTAPCEHLEWAGPGWGKLLLPWQLSSPERRQNYEHQESFPSVCIAQITAVLLCSRPPLILLQTSLNCSSMASCGTTVSSNLWEVPVAFALYLCGASFGRTC